MNSSAATFDQRAFRDVLGTFVTGVTVVTTRDKDGVAHGVTANSFSSVSLDPPLVLWSQALTSKSYPAFRDSDHFAINILADDQIEISNHFAKSREDKFSGIAHHGGIAEVPVLDGAAAHLECVKVASHLNGDHMLFVGRVENIGNSYRRGLAFSGGKYVIARSYDVDPLNLRRGSLHPVPLADIRRVMSALPDIAEQVGDYTLCLSVWGNCGPTAICWEPSAHPVSEHLFTGLVMPITQSATGMAFAAFLPSEMTQAFIEEDLRQFPVAGEDLGTRRKRFDLAVEEVRQRGLARMVGSAASALHGVPITTFCAPIRDATGNMIMALSLASTGERLLPDWEGAGARALSRAATGILARLV